MLTERNRSGAGRTAAVVSSTGLVDRVFERGMPCPGVLAWTSPTMRGSDASPAGILARSIAPVAAPSPSAAAATSLPGRPAVQPQSHEDRSSRRQLSGEPANRHRGRPPSAARRRPGRDREYSSFRIVSVPRGRYAAPPAPSWRPTCRFPRPPGGSAHPPRSARSSCCGPIAWQASPPTDPACRASIPTPSHERTEPSAGANAALRRRPIPLRRSSRRLRRRRGA